MRLGSVMDEELIRQLVSVVHEPEEEHPFLGDDLEAQDWPDDPVARITAEPGVKVGVVKPLESFEETAQRVDIMTLTPKERRIARQTFKKQTPGSSGAFQAAQAATMPGQMTTGEFTRKMLAKEGLEYEWGGTTAAGGFDCLEAGTFVTTARGEVPIENVRVDDRALTRRGYRKVLRSWLVREDAPIVEVILSNDRILRGTADHRVWTENDGWKSLSTLSSSDILMGCEKLTLLSSEESSTTATPSLRNGRIGSITKGQAIRSIVLFGEMLMGLFRKAAKSITVMGTHSITISPTFNAFRYLSTDENRLMLVPQPFVPARSAEGPIEGSLVGGLLTTSVVPNVKTSGAITTVRPLGLQRAKVADSSTKPTTTRSRSIVPVRVLSVTATKERRPVYDLTVEGDHEFFANGVLVHNCSGIIYRIMQNAGHTNFPRVSGDIYAHSKKIPLKKAIKTRGAILWHEGHIAVSLGNGKTIEAMGEDYGVVIGNAHGRFTHGGILPEMRVGKASQEAGQSKVKLKRITKMVPQDDLNRIESTESFIHAPAVFGSLMDEMEVPVQRRPKTRAKSAPGDVNPNDVEAVKRLAKRLAIGYGFTGKQWRAFVNIVEGESGWDTKADNPTSTAIGLPQRLESAHPFANAKQRKQWLNSPLLQLQWMYRYIQGRYGDPLTAWRFKQANGYY